MDMKKITHLFYWLFKAKKSGLDFKKADDRNFETGIFGWFGYAPKHSRHIIKTLSIKDQRFLNICQWCATTVQKEVDENKVLGLRSLVIYAKRNGLLSGDGFSTLPSGQKALKEFGIEDVSERSEVIGSWGIYSSGALDLANAENNKIQSYWSVTTRGDRLKLLDEGKVLTTGINWYTGYNQGGGFSSPWIIAKTSGYKVGGHAFNVIGYDLAYHGREVYVCQNSYGSSWGDNGKFYIDMDFMDKDNYGFMTNLDVEKNIGEFLNKYDGKNVKGDKSNGIFHIQKGVKKPYPSWLAFLSFNGKQRGFLEVPQEDLDQVPSGDIMDVTKSSYYEFLKDVKKDNQLDLLLTILNKEN